MRAAGLVALAGALALGGCGLLGGGKPANLYRFGADAAAATAPVEVRGGRTLALSGITFAEESEGDRILTITGGEAAYIKQTRWVAPAVDLFTAAAERAFNRAGVRLARRGQPFDTDASLVLEVPTFEARYENGAKAAPVVIVEVNASLVAGTERRLIGETTYTARQQAGENRVGAIVEAFDTATREALDHTATWAAGRAPAAGTRTAR
ncbi:MAG TPA: ABC-type transport auxiliary lipoprotein family protein [Caulobacteraceae bacterium]|jgi:cholesterol transport system auxiliary component